MSANDKVKIGVIGVGVHGLHHVRLLSRLSEVDFVGIYDASPDVAASVTGEFEIPAYDTVESLLEAVDCVTVAVPTSMHHEIGMQSLRADRHVLVEKPIASNTIEADEMIAEAESRNLVFAVGHLERFNPAYRAITTAIPLQPAFIETHRLAVFNPRGTDVAVVLDLMIHDIDIVLDMVKMPVVSVSAVGIPVVTDEVDIANARLEFEGGCVANLTASRISQKKMRKIRTFQKKAYISMDCLTGESELFTLRDDVKPEGFAGALPQVMGGISYKRFPNDGGNALEIELRDFITAVAEGGKPAVSGRDGRQALDVAMTIMNSMEKSLRRLV